MKSNEIDDKASRIAREILNSIDENKSAIEIFRNFSLKDWGNWLSDIINLEIAYPIVNITPDGDALIDIVEYLRKGNISVFLYEQAISILLTQEYKQNKVNSNLIERLIDVVIETNGNHSTLTLIEILIAKKNKTHKGKLTYQKTSAILALSQSLFLNEKQKLEIFNYVALIGINEMEHDPYFYSSSLRFCYKQISLKAFYDILILIFKTIEKFEDFEIKNSIQELIVDKIEEIHYSKPHIFHSHFYHWLLQTQSLDQPLNLEDNVCYKYVIKSVGNLIKHNELEFPTLQGDDITNELKYRKSIEFILAVDFEIDLENKLDINEPAELLEVLSFIKSNSENPKKFLINKFTKHVSFVHSTGLRIVSYTESTDKELKLFVENILENVLYNHQRISSSAGIKKFFTDLNIFSKS